jgi:hypothetical protein
MVRVERLVRLDVMSVVVVVVRQGVRCKKKKGTFDVWSDWPAITDWRREIKPHEDTRLEGEREVLDGDERKRRDGYFGCRVLLVGSLASTRSKEQMKDEAMLWNEHCIVGEVDMEIPLSMRQEM